MTVKLTVVKWSAECWIVICGSTTDHKRHWNEQVYYAQVLEEVHEML